MQPPKHTPNPMDPIIHDLNHAQRDAVTSPASILQVLAPPGSGKTKTLTARVAYLLSHHGYQPQDVICCTFTIKASREMRERLAKLVGDDVQSRLILGTFHSICRRYLVSYGYLIGLRRGFGIADSSDSLAIIKRIVKRLQLNILPNIARSRISHQKAHGISPDEVAKKYASSAAKVQENREFIQVYREYEAQLAASHLLDYDDLLVRCAELLRRHPSCVSNVQAVLVDEFQDTNHIQYELMNLFAAQNRRITVVGDPDQSIYGFRSAEIKNLGRMQQRYRDTAVVLLEDNYRSSGSILNSAQDVIEQDTSRPAKKLQPTHSVGTMPVLRKLPTADAEAQWIVLEIKRCMAMTGKLLNYSDFAILLRSASLSRQIESEMGKHGMPYRMVGGLRFFDRVEIKLLLDYLRVISQPGNTDALLRILNVPSRKIGEETVRSLMSGAEKTKQPLWDFIKDVAQGRRSTEKTLAKPANHGLCTFVGLIESSRRKLLECTDNSAPRKLLDYVIKRLSFRDYLTALHGTNEENRWANVEELLAQADDTKADDHTEPDDRLPEIEGLAQQEAHAGEEALSRFLANVALSTEVRPQEGEEGTQSQEKVTISTIHAAKGLEWPVVFVPAVYNGIIPHSRADDWDEERRLLYVAMTRAQALLYLSYPLEQARSGEETTVSDFLPDKIVESRFRSIGPSLRDKTVYDIADILRRPRPSAEAISEGQMSLISTLDDQWTPEGQEAPGALLTWDGVRVTGDGEPYPKRRRYGTPESSSTMAVPVSTYSIGRSNLSVTTTMSSFGFSTAREYIATTTAGPTSQPRASNPGLHGRKANEPSQKSISGFFSAGQATRGESAAPGRHQPRGNQRVTEPSAPPPPPPSRPPGLGSGMPPNFSSHRPQVHRPTRPTLKPSDPNRYTWLGTSSTTTDMSKATVRPRRRGGPENGEVGDGKGQGSAEWGDRGIKRTDGLVGGVRPAATYHTTTMAMVQGVGGAPARRTLGIRRSMNGWEERMKRGNGGTLR